MNRGLEECDIHRRVVLGRIEGSGLPGEERRGDNASSAQVDLANESTHGLRHPQSLLSRGSSTVQGARCPVTAQSCWGRGVVGPQLQSSLQEFHTKCHQLWAPHPKGRRE